MFGNLSAEAGVISSALSNSPNIIQPTLTWDFNNVIVFDFVPTDDPNINNRPRINVWRSVEGQPDLDYLLYVDAGKEILSPAPTGFLMYSQGSGRGSYTFPQTSIVGQKIIAGVDFFTHTFTEVETTPPLSEWIADYSIPGEIKYQYRFEIGDKNPQISIDIYNKLGCDPTLPKCIGGQAIAFLGTGDDGCPRYQCRTLNSANIEIGLLYPSNFYWSSGSRGLANLSRNFDGFTGYWFIYSGSGTFRNILDSSQNGRNPLSSANNKLQPINNAFFIVGSSENSSKNLVNYILYNENLVKTVETQNILSLDANYSWFGGERNIYFYTGFKFSNFDENDYFYKITHKNSSGNRLIFERKNIGNYPFRTATITGNAFNKSFHYEFTKLDSGFLFEVKSNKFLENILFTDLVTGTNIQFIDSIYSIRGLGFEASLDFNVSSTDWFNYGMFFNNIELSNNNKIPYPVFDGGSWNYVPIPVGSDFIDYYFNINDASTYPEGLTTTQLLYIEDLLSDTKRCMSGCWLYPIDLPKGQNVWRDSALLLNGRPHAMFNSNSCLAMSNDGKYQTAVSYRNQYNNWNYKPTLGAIWVSNDYGFNWNRKANNESDYLQSICMNGNGQYQSALISPEEAYVDNIESPVWAWKYIHNKIRTGLLIYNSTDYGETWAPQIFNQYTGAWKKIVTNNEGNMKIVISDKFGIGLPENNPNMLISFDSGSTWNNYFYNQYQDNTSFNDIAMSKDGKYVIACTNVFDRSRPKSQTPRAYFSSNSGQTWNSGFAHQPIYFNRFIVKDYYSSTFPPQPGEVLLRDYGYDKYIAYIHDITLDNEPSILEYMNEIVIRNVDDPNLSLEGETIWVGGNFSEPNVTRYAFRKTSVSPTPIFDNTSHWFVSPKIKSLPNPAELYTYPYHSAALSNDGKVQVMIDRDTKNDNYPGIIVSHDYGETWRVSSRPYRYVSPNICDRALQTYRFPYFQHSVTMSHDGKYQFLNDLWYSENSGITWSNNKIGDILQLGWNGLPADVKLSSGGNFLALARRDFLARFPDDVTPYANNIYNIDNFFDEDSRILLPPYISASNITYNSFQLYWNNVDNATGYLIDVATTNAFTTFVNEYENFPVGNITQVITGLQPNSVYWVRGRSVNENETSIYSTYITVSTSTTAGKYQTAVTINDGGNIAGKIYRSEDFGKNWTPINTNFNALYGVAMSYNGQIQSVVERDGFIYSSEDFGLTWTAKTSSHRAWSDIAMSYDGKCQTAVIAFTGDIEIDLVSASEIFTSYDSGNTWIPRATGFDWAGIAMSSGGDIQTAIEKSGGIYISSNSGQTWSGADWFIPGYHVVPESILGLNYTDISMSFDGKYQTVTVINGQILTSTNYGQLWTTEDINFVKNWSDVAMNHNGGYQIANSYNDTLYVSYDTGKTWSPQAGSEVRTWQGGLDIDSNGKNQSAGVFAGPLVVSNNFGTIQSEKMGIKIWGDVAVNKGKII